MATNAETRTVLSLHNLPLLISRGGAGRDLRIHRDLSTLQWLPHLSIEVHTRRPILEP
jgi:hypothetical protein